MLVAGPLALVGSGEYLPVLTEVEAELIAGRPPRFVQLATAAAPEGPLALAHWHELGRQAAERLGVEQVVLPVVDRADAESAEIAALVEGAGLIYLSGGNPGYLAATLRGTAVGDAIVAAWRAGSALAGCSAGAIALTNEVPDIDDLSQPAQPGLGVVPQLRVLPHFDRFGEWVSAADLERLASAPPGINVVGIDEDTALVGGPSEWTVRGRQSAWVLNGVDRTEFAAGCKLTTP